MTHFRTIIKPGLQKYTVSHKDSILMVGSCFTENIGALLERYLFPVLINPFGISYNPVSVASGLQQIIKKKSFGKNDIFYHNGLWNSFQHHGEFSHPDADTCINNINDSISKAYQYILKTNYLFITFGTAYVYKLKETNIVVSNCHKVEPDKFQRYLLSADEIYERYVELLNHIFKINPEIHIIFTISPIRHIKDGFVQNQLSKSILNVSVHRIIETFKNQTSYFPSYEIMMDDLRDYRFYAEDMLHPNSQAIKYIWSFFSEFFFDAKTKEAIKDIEKLCKSIEHRPFNAEGEQYADFLKFRSDLVKTLKQRYNYIDFQSIEKKQWIN